MASRRLLPLLDDYCGCSTQPRRRNKAALLCSWQYDPFTDRSDRQA